MAKNVLITGASKGIGEEIAYRFAREGYNLGLCYCKDKNGAEKIGKKCKDLGSGEIFFIELDLRKDESIREAIKKFVGNFGKIDFLINNAGVVRGKPALKHSFEDLQEIVDVNVSGLMKMTTEAVKNMGGGVIVNVSSGAAHEVYEHIIPYCASKFAVRAYTIGLGLELPRKIRVYSVNPGLTATRMTNFKGVHPSVVAEVVYDAALEKKGLKSGEDVDVE